MGHLLFIGPTLTAHPRQIGGTTKSFGILLKFVKKSGIDFRLVSTNRFAVPGELLVNAAYVLLRGLFSIPRASVVIFNANPRGATFLGPVLSIYATAWRKPFVFRMFGGDLIEVFEAQPAWSQSLLRHTILKADLVYLQTRRLVAYFSQFSAAIHQLPTSREPHGIRRNHHEYRRKLVFIGQIKRSKGIEHVLRFQKEHADSYTVNIFGPILEDEFHFLENHACYKGIVPPDQVNETLSNFDLLLLPTFYPGEGYPGIIIEANSVGLPAVSTNWLAIPEIVLHNETGVLAEPDDYASMEHAILSIDDAKYHHLSRNALAWSERFDSDKLCQEILEEIQRLTTSKKT